VNYPKLYPSYWKGTFDKNDNQDISKKLSMKNDKNELWEVNSKDD
jgi:hypothetical protein